ncbi:MAG: hypothetical protein EFT35_03345 [Methanophagales archaeon ANME-1-THS]|nr:MAG: hypothetical protein EFT35_03345 [Methanophagales archaeon ANME-1-THS]
MLVLVVDANRVFSTLLSKGGAFDVFLASKLLKRFEFIALEYLFQEIGMHFDELVERSKLSSEELTKVFRFVKEEIEFIPFEEFKEYAGEAEEIAPHVKDLQYFALALASECGIWSDDKAFKKQSRVKVYSTEELLKLLSKATP